MLRLSRATSSYACPIKYKKKDIYGHIQFRIAKSRDHRKYSVTLC